MTDQLRRLSEQQNRVRCQAPRPVDLLASLRSACALLSARAWFAQLLRVYEVNQASLEERLAALERKCGMPNRCEHME